MPVSRNTAKKSSQRPRRRRSRREARRRAAIRRRRIALLCLVAIVVGIVMFFNKEKIEAPAPGAAAIDIEASRQAGITAAEEALATREGTMAREAALLKIRSKESEIRNAGFIQAADAFFQAADEKLRE